MPPSLLAIDLRQSYELAVLLSGLVLLTVLVVRGQSIFLAAPLSAFVTLAASGLDPVAGITGAFMTGFAEYLRQFFLIFALGAAFGKLVDRSGAAVAIAQGVTRWLGAARACLAVVLACAILTYGGVSLFVVGFAVYPLAVQLFRAADLPRRFIPGAIAFGSITFTMTSAGSPEIQNLIPIKYLVSTVNGVEQPLTDARAGWPVSLIVAAGMFLVGQVYLDRAIARDRRQGARFEPRPADAPPADGNTRLPRLWRALAPLVMTLVILNLAGPLLAGVHGAWRGAEESSTGAHAMRWLNAAEKFVAEPTVAIFVGLLAAVVCLGRYVPRPTDEISSGFIEGLIAIGSTSSVVGFGSALRELPAFMRLVESITTLPLDPLLGAGLAVAVICGVAGSASGGQGLAWPIIKPIYIDGLGVAPRALHRVVAIASGSLDSLPANGYLVMLIRHICGDTHRRAYGPVFVTTVLIPLAGTLAAVGLFRMFPSWGQL